MKTIAHCGWALAFAGLLWSATSIGAGAGRTPPSTPQDATAGALTQAQLAGLEKQMFDLVNHDRQDPAYSAETGGRAQLLKWNEKLAAVARAHSRNMVEKGYFAHTDPDGTTFSARIIATGIRWQAMAENIASNRTVAGAETGFMSEPPSKPNHRSNILSVTATDIGIGIVPGANGNLYITQDFVATPPSRGGANPAP
jgi:uncharacterized protein YkwD